MDIFSQGCVRKKNLSCGNSSATFKDRFRMIPYVTLPKYYETVKVTSATQCESTCFNNCSCTAYAYDGTECLTWTGELLNLQQLSQDDHRGRNLFIKLAASDFPSDDQGQRNFLAHLQSRDNDLTNEDDDNNIDIVPFFSFESILAATNQFSEANMLGQGGFGPVYKGKFLGGREIAVKRLSTQSRQGIEEFTNEVLLIARVQHRNLVKLLGYCVKGRNEKIVLYEFMLNKSLDTFIFDQQNRALLDWKKRFDIIVGIARGMSYLHHDSRLTIIHRDLKTSNILLDEGMNPKISDFGLARIVQGDYTLANTTKIAGTCGYMSPEYMLNGVFSTKSDVFSFGVIILEIVSGRRNTGFYQCEEAMNLIQYAWRLWTAEKAITMVDESLLETCNMDEALKCINIGLLCVQEHPCQRPSMSSVILMLGGESMILPKPNQPAFVARTAISSKSTTSYTKNGLTITIEQGR
ncbi:G-type lectin S-receptor-like serine/threonine-protein kinase At4g27290 [Lycium ferocissimum]|uniref:G-type lectin S-receptor-like serine/threonine-protein kinase At4g27290 n=1 Tax=Lycium ferocissimum TaxID=112874 RepID=UPI0028163473|nr:G-type lectin S-receptor-like serine/threonine-protein kinase At4g27290 [Lycium ferocissimum]